MKQTSDDLIEMITIRLYNIGDTHIVHDMLKELAETFKKKDASYQSIRLCKSEQVENDWAIYFKHPASTAMINKKSDLAVRLAETLRDIGLVNHTVWKPCDTRDIDELMRS